MARVYGITKRLPEYGVDEKLAKEIIGEGDLIKIIERMEKSLDPEITRQILDSCACGGGKEYEKRLKQVGREIVDKTLSEKIDHVNSLSPETKVTLNPDNTLTVRWSFPDGEKYKCLCGAAVRPGVRVCDSANATDEGARPVPLTYCYCCAGSGRRHLQIQLGVELRTKEILSSPINSRGEKPCELILDIV